MTALQTCIAEEKILDGMQHQIENFSFEPVSDTRYPSSIDHAAVIKVLKNVVFEDSTAGASENAGDNDSYDYADDAMRP